MTDPEKTITSKKRTNLSLNSALLNEAKILGINISQSAEAGIEQAVKRYKQAKWLEDNAKAIESSNNYVSQHGLPLAKHRNF